MVFTKDEFKELWNSEGGGGITFDDIADCAKAWGLFSMPRCGLVTKVTDAVLKAAGCAGTTKAEWHKYPQEKPTHNGDYLIRGVGGLDNRPHHWLCLWLDVDIVKTGFYYNGNEFDQIESGEFEFLDVTEL